MLFRSTPVFLPGEFHAQRSLAGYSPWGHKRVGRDLVTLELGGPSRDSTGFGAIEEGLISSGGSLENPRDGGAWWAAVYGVAQSRTQLKRLGSNSSSSYKIKYIFKIQCI